MRLGLLCFRLSSLTTTAANAFCVALTGLVLAAGPVHAQNLTPTTTEGSPAQSDDLPAVEPVIVTGSNIPRAAEEVPASPVVTIDRQGIDDSGRATLGGVLQRLPINSGGANDETNPFSAPGSSGLSLRGLGQNSTLTIIDGRRVAPYALPLNGTDTFTDLNGIPLGAVQRVEILKDGASAIYGADAVAGVVNIILRDDYQGLELTSRYGNTTHNDAGEIHEQLVSGVTNKKGSLLFTGEFYKSNEQRLSDRDYSRSADSAHNPPGLTTADPNYHPFTYPGLAGAGTFPPGTPYGYDQRASVTFPGAFTLPDGSTVSAIPGTTGQSLGDYRAGYVPYNYNKDLTDHPDIDRYSFFAKGKYELLPALTVYTELLYNHSDSRIQLAPANLDSLYVAPLLIPADNPYNPFGVPIGYGANNGTSFTYRELGLGNFVEHISADFYRALLGSTVKLPLDFSFDSAGLYSQSHVYNLVQNSISGPAAQAALDSTDPATALNVFSGLPGANSPQILNRIRTDFYNNSTSELWLFDGRLNGPAPFLKLPAGPVQLALGGEYRHERLNDRQDPLSTAHQVTSGIGITLFGQRDVYAGFYEVDVPVFSPAWNFPGAYALDLVVAQRYEHYSDFGGYSAPKFTLREQPIRDLTLRGSYSEGVRAPSLSELGGRQVGYSNLIDPLGLGGGPTYLVNFDGNPDLRPEKSYTLYGGFVYSPSYAFFKGLSISLDWSQIIRRGTIQNLPLFNILQQYGRDPAGNAVVVRSPDGTIDQINDALVNVGAVKVRTFDYDVSYHYDTARFGTFSFDGTGTYLQSYKVITGLGDPNPGVAGYNNKIVSYAGTDAFGGPQPQFKAQGSVFWNYRFDARSTAGGTPAGRNAKDGKDRNLAAEVAAPVSYAQAVNFGATLNYVGAYQEGVINLDRTGGLKAFNDAPGSQLAIRTVQSFTTVDLLASYTYKHATLTVGVNNVGDEKPPFIYGNDQGQAAGYDPSQANSLGRFVYTELKFKF